LWLGGGVVVGRGWVGWGWIAFLMARYWDEGLV
jgi:hypothetical protein